MQHIFAKILGGAWLAIIVILLGMSVLALFILHWSLIEQYNFSFTPEAVNNYLSAYSKYQSLFAGTLATIGAYYGVHRLRVAAEANLEKIKQDRFTEWKIPLDNALKEIRSDNKYMARTIIQIRHYLFLQLYEMGFNIRNKQQLSEVFNRHFAPLIQKFEQQSKQYIGIGGIYESVTYAYAHQNLRSILLTCIQQAYNEFDEDLQSFYIERLPSNRHIDSQIFLTNQRLYLTPGLL